MKWMLLLILISRLRQNQGSTNGDQWPSIKRKMLRQMTINIQQAGLVIRLGQREIKLMRMKWMKSLLEEESWLKRVEYAEQHYWRKGGRRSMEGWWESNIIRFLMMTRKLRRMTCLMTWIIRLALSGERLITG